MKNVYGNLDAYQTDLLWVANRFDVVTLLTLDLSLNNVGFSWKNIWMKCQMTL